MPDEMSLYHFRFKSKQQLTSDFIVSENASYFLGLIDVNTRHAFHSPEVTFKSDHQS